MDFDSQKLVHVHLHYQLSLSYDFDKSFTLPIVDALPKGNYSLSKSNIITFLK